MYNNIDAFASGLDSSIGGGEGYIFKLLIRTIKYTTSAIKWILKQGVNKIEFAVLAISWRLYYTFKHYGWWAASGYWDYTYKLKKPKVARLVHI